MTDESALTPTVTEQELLASEIIRDLEAIDAKIRRLELLAFEPDDFVRAHVNVPVRFLVSTVVLVEHTPLLRGTHRLDVAEGYETLQILRAFDPVFDRVMALAKRLKLNLRSRKARLGWQCLQMYGIAKGLIRDGRDPDLAARVEMLGRDLGPRGRPRKARTS